MPAAAPFEIPKDCPGIIVVDNCTLEVMDANIRESSFVRDARNQDILGTPAKYVDLLRFFAKQGYFVIIPETVALDSAHRTTAGSTDAYFPKSGSKQDTYAGALISEALKGQHPNIVVWPLDERSPSLDAVYMGRINHVLRGYDPDNDVRRIQGRARLTDIQHDKSRYKGLARISAHEIITHLMQSPSQPMVHYFTHSKYSGETCDTLMKRYPGRVAHLSAQGFWNAIADSELAPHLGFHSPVKQNQIRQDYDPHDLEKAGPIIDSIRPFEQGDTFIRSARPFLHSLNKMVAKLPSPATVAEQPVSMAARIPPQLPPAALQPQAEGAPAGSELKAVSPQVKKFENHQRIAAEMQLKRQKKLTHDSHGP